MPTYSFTPADGHTVRTAVPATPPPGGVLSVPGVLADLAALPEVGDSFLEFSLVDELGRGGFGRVFLAEQRELANRQVALKVTVGGDAESQNLARLQHTNIVPIYSAHQDGPLVAVCMPFFGRSTLGDLCSSVRTMPNLPDSGGHVVSTLEAKRHAASTRTNQRFDRTAVATPEPARAPKPAADSAVRPPLPNLTRLGAMSYTDAVLWIGERIADGLAHAHDRGIVHRDLKPANVLVTDDGQPMILDFNLAVRGRDAAAARGGTVPYMSPEQLRGMTGERPELDARTDLYSLGILLYELLAGRHPFPPPDATAPDLLGRMLAARTGPRPPLRVHNRAVTPTVEAIVHKCLAPDPADRYQTAHQLIDDLKRHRADLPVRHAGNPSWRERAAKWVRRHPRLASPPAVAALTAGVLLALTAGVAWRSFETKRTEGVRNAERGRELASEFDALRGTAEQYLTSHHGKPELIARGRDAGFRALDALAAGHTGRWDERPEFAHLPHEERARLTNRAAELEFLIGRTADGGTAAGFWERFPTAAGRAPVFRAAELHAGGKFRDSILDLEGYARAHPDDAGGWFLLGRAHAECGSSEDAYLAYSAGIALRPRYAAGYHFRAEVADRLKKVGVGERLPQALLDANRAVELDPEFVEARLLRAQLWVQGKQYEKARDDLDRILDGAEPPTRAWLLRAAVRTHLGDKPGAAADRAEGLRRKPESATDYVARGVARREADPNAALADFRAAEVLAPANPTVLEHQAYVQAELLHRPDQAADTLARLLRHTPHSPYVFINRAVYLARSGKTADAVAEAEKARELSPRPEIQYRVGCVFALAAKTDPKYAAPALTHLAAALRGGFGHEHLPADPDLDPLRGRPEFVRLAGLIAALNELTAPK